jgi:hypothetical protein
VGLVAAQRDEVDGPRPQPAQAEAKLAPVQAPVTPRPDDADPLVYAGVVLDHEGKPLAGARLFVRSPTADQDEFLPGTTSRPDGHFRFEVARAAFDKSRQDNPWMYAAVVATADGFGPVWMSAATPPLPGTQPADRLTLRLAKDDIPIEGRILTAEGQSVAAAKVQPIILQYRQNRDLVHIPWDSNDPGPGTMGINLAVTNVFPAVAADADGRFTLKGIGRDRMIQVVVSGPNIASQVLEIETRPGPMRTLPGVGIVRNGKLPTKIRYGARFEHIAAPSRPVVGVVRQRGSGQPIPGALINFGTTTDAHGRFIGTTTDAHGRFRLEGMPNEVECILYVNPPAGQPYFPREVTIAAQGAGLEPVTTDVAMTKGVLLRGRLTDKQTGRPIRGFPRYVPLKGNPHIDELPTPPYSNRREMEGPSDSNGRFAFAVPPGPGVVVVRAGTGDNVWYPPVRRVSDADRARGLAYPGDDALLDTVPRPTPLLSFNAYRVVDIPEEGVEAFDCDFTIDAGATRGGPIVDPDDKPLERVEVYGLRDLLFDSWGLVMDREFAARNLEPGIPRRVFFFHSGRNLSGHCDVRVDALGPIRAQLGACGTITGRLVDSRGAPVAAVHLRLVFEDAEGIPHVSFPEGHRVSAEAEMKRGQLVSGFIGPGGGGWRWTSDSDGRFRIEDVIPGTRFHLIAVPTRVEAVEKTTAQTAVLPGQVLDLGDIRIDGDTIRR